jgi:hypothetical protein
MAAEDRGQTSPTFRSCCVGTSAAALPGRHIGFQGQLLARGFQDLIAIFAVDAIVLLSTTSGS